MGAGESGFDAARGERNLLERLRERIPGFAGFADRELRRDVDKLQREEIAAAVRRVKDRLRESARDHTDAGRLGPLDRFGRLDARLDGLAESIRFSDYGTSGLFAPDKIGERELDELYRFDLSLLDDVDEVARRAGEVPGPGDASPEAALDGLLEAVRQVETKWDQRDTVIADVVRAAG
jgi:hypothetical protein